MSNPNLALALRWSEEVWNRRLIATIDYDAPTVTTVDALEWKGPKPEAV